MRMALVGAGSLGTIIGALITKGGQDIVLVDSNKDHMDALNSKGATITGKMNLNVPVKACAPEEMSGMYDAVIYLAKGPSNAEALTKIFLHLNEKSMVCTLQNGIPEDGVARFVGRQRTIGGAVGFGASWVEPGVSRLTSDPGKMLYDVGELDGSVTPRVQKVKSVLDLAGRCEITTNLSGLRWAKLLINAAFSGMSAALGCTYGDVLDSKKAMFSAAFIVDECIKVAHGEGTRLSTIQGADFEQAELKKGKADIPSKMPFYITVVTPHRPVIASMLFDLRLGRATEIDFINGEVAARGRKIGVPTPFNDKVVELVKEAEARKGVNTLEYLSRFDDLILSAK